MWTRARSEGDIRLVPSVVTRRRGVKRALVSVSPAPGGATRNVTSLTLYTIAPPSTSRASLRLQLCLFHPIGDAVRVVALGG